MLNIQKINSRFRAVAEIIIKYRWLNIILFLGVLLAAGIGLTRLENDIDQDNWFLEDDALRITEQHFEDIFGNEDFCAIPGRGRQCLHARGARGHPRDGQGS